MVVSGREVVFAYKGGAIAVDRWVGGCRGPTNTWPTDGRPVGEAMLLLLTASASAL